MKVGSRHNREEEGGITTVFLDYSIGCKTVVLLELQKDMNR